MNMKNRNILHEFYVSRVEGGSHDNLKREILKHLKNYGIKARRYLDVGCTDGSLTLKVAEILRANEVLGIDNSESALREVQRT